MQATLRNRNSIEANNWEFNRNANYIEELHHRSVPTHHGSEEPIGTLTRITLGIAPIMLAFALFLAGTTSAQAQLPDPGMEIETGRTAVLITDPQNDFLSPDAQDRYVRSQRCPQPGRI